MSLTIIDSSVHNADILTRTKSRKPLSKTPKRCKGRHKNPDVPILLMNGKNYHRFFHRKEKINGLGREWRRVRAAPRSRSMVATLEVSIRVIGGALAWSDTKMAARRTDGNRREPD